MRTSNATFHGVKWDMTATFQLVALADDVATLDVDMAMRAGSQTLSVDPTELAKLTAATGHVTEQLKVPLHAPMAIGTIRAATEMTFFAERGRARAVSSIQTDITSSVKRLDAP